MFIFHYVSLQMHLHLFTFTHTYHCVAFSCTDFVLLHSVIAIYTADESNSNGSLNASSCKRCSDGWVTSLLRGRNLMLQVLHVVCCLLLPGTVEVQPDRGSRGSRQNFETAVLDRVTVERGEKDAQADVNVGKMSNWILWCFHLQRLRKQRDTWTVRICLASACRFALALCSPLWGSLKFKRPKTVNNAVKPSVAVSTPLNANSANAGVIKVWLDWKKRKERGTKVYTNMLFLRQQGFRSPVYELRETSPVTYRQIIYISLQWRCFCKNTPTTGMLMLFFILILFMCL